MKAFDAFLEELEISPEIIETHGQPAWTYAKIVELLALPPGRLIEVLGLTVTGMNHFSAIRANQQANERRRLAGIQAWRGQLAEYLKAHRADVESGRYYLHVD